MSRSETRRVRESVANIQGRPPMLFVLLLVVLGLVGVSVVLLQRNRDKPRARRNSYFTHTLGVSDPAPPAARDEPPAA